MTLVFSSGSYTCPCDSGYVLVGETLIGPQSCISASLAVNLDANTNALTAIFGPNSVRSITLGNYFIRAAANCKYYNNPSDMQWCQVLANLCILQMYDFYMVGGACSEYSSILQSRGVDNNIDGVQNWVPSLPWIIYSSSGGFGVCKDDTLTEKMALSNKYLEYVISSYTMNGTWLGYREAETILNYCTKGSPYSDAGGGTGSSTRWQIFGTFQKLELECDLGSLLGTEQLFYELFLKDTKTGKLYPVPVRVEQFIDSSGSFPNSMATTGFADKHTTVCEQGNVYVRRFMLYDIVSGIPQTPLVDSNNNLLPSYVRFASFIRMQVSIQVANPELIYAPVLSLSYSYSAVADWGATYTAETTYTVQGEYTMDTTTFQTSVFAAQITGIIIVGLMFGQRWLNWRRRLMRPFVVGQEQPNVFQLDYFVDGLCMLMHSAVLVGFPALTLYCWYWFTFYKLQDTVAVMLPPQIGLLDVTSFYFPVMLMLILLTSFQIIHISRMIYKQVNADIFFLDWEPPASKSGNKKGKVSVWRTILIANEWNELSNTRRTDIRFTLFFMGFFLLGMDLQYNATQQPDLNDKTPGEINVVLQFANTTWWWFILSMAQFLWKFCLYERFISEPPEQVFIDMCTLAKISLLILDEPYHGYYLHCRSPHQYADGSMEELVDMLHKEEAGLTVDRSMEGAPADVQSFELFLTSDWRIRFNKLYYTMIADPTLSEGLNRGNIANARAVGSGTWCGCGQSRAPPSQRVVKAWSDLTSFLQEFFDNNFSKVELKRIVNEPTYIESLLKLPPNLFLSGNPNVFRPDRRFLFAIRLINTSHHY